MQPSETVRQCCEVCLYTTVVAGPAPSCLPAMISSRTTSLARTVALQARKTRSLTRSVSPLPSLPSKLRCFRGYQTKARPVYGYNPEVNSEPDHVLPSRPENSEAFRYREAFRRHGYKYARLNPVSLSSEELSLGG